MKRDSNRRDGCGVWWAQRTASRTAVPVSSLHAAEFRSACTLSLRASGTSSPSKTFSNSTYLSAFRYFSSAACAHRQTRAPPHLFLQYTRKTQPCCIVIRCAGGREHASIHALLARARDEARFAHWALCFGLEQRATKQFVFTEFPPAFREGGGLTTSAAERGRLALEA